MLFFVLVVVIDIEHRLILHPVSLVGVAIGGLVGWWMHGLLPTLIGGLVGFGTMYLLFKFGELFTRISSRLRGEPIDEVALGFGDVNLSGVLGLLLGWPVILMGLILAILAGGLYSLVYLLLSIVLGRYRSFEAMPYAPYLILAAALLLFFPGAARAILAGLSPLMAAAFK
jgi:leader peptidase (prepilin peptidase)/N-methyltransferase